MIFTDCERIETLFKRQKGDWVNTRTEEKGGKQKELGKGFSL